MKGKTNKHKHLLVAGTHIKITKKIIQPETWSTRIYQNKKKQNIRDKRPIAMKPGESGWKWVQPWKIVKKNGNMSENGQNWIIIGENRNQNR